MHALVSRVQQFLSQLELASPRIIVAVSGGPDSVALLRGLHELQLDLSIAHLNHLLRGSESDEDQSFVEQLALELRLPCYVERIDIRCQAALQKENQEAFAREARYGWFARLARELSANVIATGHTANDQAETVLHRLLRGTGIAGLRGIAPMRVLEKDIRVIRPLLSVSRDEVLDYLAEIGQAWREDRSNRDRQYTRNRIRHELLPQLTKDFNPNMVGLLANLAILAQEQTNVLDALLAPVLAQLELPNAGAILVLDKRELGKLSRPLVREIFRRIWTREGWPRGGMTFEHWDRLAELVFDEASAWQLPSGVVAKRVGQVVQLVPPS